MIRSTILSLMATGILFLTGCAGYKLGPVKPTELAHIETLAVPTFLNDTLEPRISVMVTNQVIKTLQNDGSYKVASLENADAVMRGRIEVIDRRQARGARTEVLRTRELEVTVNIQFAIEHAETGAVLSKGVSRGHSTVFLDPNFQLSERQAIQKASEEAARRLVSSISEGF
ncbi:MAG: LPS assembly lipoprotein LptE [Verrucomicrobiota bacterium]